MVAKDVKIISHLRTNMRELPNSEFDQKRYLGLRRYYEAKYLVTMTIRPADFKFKTWYMNSLQCDPRDISWELDGSPICGSLDQVPLSPLPVKVISL